LLQHVGANHTVISSPIYPPRSPIPTPAHILTVIFEDNMPSSLANDARPALLKSNDDEMDSNVVSSWPLAEPPPHWWQDQIDFRIPLPKISRHRDEHATMFPPGSLFDPEGLDGPPSSTSAFDFPFDLTPSQALVGMMADLPDIPSILDSVTHVVGLPRICDLSGNTSSTVTVHPSGSNDDTTLVDTGVNMCVTGMVELLVDVVKISPLPISVAVHGAGVSLDDCCTHQGLLPLTMVDGSIYYQICFYCKNIVETIIFSQAIVAGSNLCATWQQTGHKDGSPGILCFLSDSGLATMSPRLCIPAGFRQNPGTELGFRHFEKQECVPSLTGTSTYLCTK
jgi:hypothetical protein